MKVGFTEEEAGGGWGTVESQLERRVSPSEVAVNSVPCAVFVMPLCVPSLKVAVEIVATPMHSKLGHTLAQDLRSSRRRTKRSSGSGSGSSGGSGSGGRTPR